MNAATKQTQVTNLVKISHSTLLTAMGNAAMSSVYALHTEMATGLAVYAIAGNTRQEAKRDMLKLYTEAGWDCATPAASEYKSVSRRLNASAALYEYLVRTSTLDQWVGAGAEMMLIDNIVHKLQEHKLKTINGILEYAEKPVLLRANTTSANEPRHTQKEFPSPAIKEPPVEGTSVEGTSNVRAFKRRSEDKLEGAARYEDWLNKRAVVAPDASKAGHKVFTTAHITVDVSDKASKAEIASVIVKLLALSEERGTRTHTAMADKLSAALIDEKEQELPGDNIGNVMPPKSKRMLDVHGNIAAKEEYVPEVNGNVPEPMKPAKRQARTHRLKAKA